MKFYFNYIRLEFKRAYKSFPKMILGAIILLIVIGALAFCGEKLLYANSKHDKARVAFVTEDTSKLVPMVTMLLQSSESISSLCEFVNTDCETAKKLVKNNEVIASITIPEGFINGLRHGINVPIVISFADNMTSMAGLLKELSQTATRTLSCSQAGIFAQADFYTAHNTSDKLYDANYKLNEEYLGFIFKRNSLFSKTTVSTTSNISVKEYYISGGLTLFFMMFSMSFAGFMMEDTKTLKKKLFSKYINIPQYFISKIIIIFSMFYLMYLLISVPMLLFVKYNLFEFFIPMIAILLSLSSVIVMFYVISPNKLSSVILIFIFSIASAILSGCILPTHYLPTTLATIGSFLPSTHIINVIAGIIASSLAVKNIVFLLIDAIICFAVSIVFEKKARFAK